MSISKNIKKVIFITHNPLSLFTPLPRQPVSCQHQVFQLMVFRQFNRFVDESSRSLSQLLGDLVSPFFPYSGPVYLLFDRIGYRHFDFLLLHY